ncbi:HD domain-containing phosphohydrolase [Candidatus Venteria ishoeyi]|uniref:Cyclic di-GMP phosphodiesterase response regulator RpfG n=1 Tax=Candidatus Venteria ishoeyi TaxID=1899563 RepID=A0A1H6FDX4_9GAMM|nr:HD domain-containing phosphohydrolase [Candidatus Venteria ishoeyi]MDM8547121.1 HD domain-containing phosphohydrolase [Candidatus Venteria ishoeyi]SEH08268.1 Cyclic di-GMP phosphodiesterase response regulator RpfG [Candidatus Venteria ishoeyi]
MDATQQPFQHEYLDDDLLNRLKKLNAVGVALSSEKDGNRLLERILQAAKTLTYADGGTLYMKQGDTLKFEIMLNETLGIHKGGSSGEPINFPPLPLYDENNKPNLHIVAACAAVQEETINIPDAYEETRFELSGMRDFDAKMHYRSKSFLTVPMKNHENEVIGVLQLINATTPETKAIHPFTRSEQELVESLASQAAIALVNQRFIAEQKELFESFIKLIARAIDDKSPYTGGHCTRVPVITTLLADAIAKTKTGPQEIRDFQMNEDERYELWVAGMLHDCGKITTKEYVVDKATKLETIFDRVHLVDARFELIKRDTEIAMLRAQIDTMKQGQTPDFTAMETALDNTRQTLDEERDFLHHSNKGGEFMAEADQNKIRQIAQRTWTDKNGQQRPLLFDDKATEVLFYPPRANEQRPETDLAKFRGEIENLCINKGTLRDRERLHINHHITSTINMLESLPYPKHLKRVPEFAGGHHERMDGKGYPKGLKRRQMSLQARSMGIADVFEALTAGDRPYKPAMKLSVALTILGKLKLEGHIDPDIFDVFIHQKVYERYAKEYLKAEQIDEFDVTRLPGYSPPA